MRIVFMGTPEFAVPSLLALLAAGHQLVAVYTQPDKPKNRGMKLTASPVKAAALEHGIPVCQPKTLRDGTVLKELAAFAPDLIVVAAYGKLLPPAVLELPRLGCVNVHASLLPQYRGAAPINWAVLNGERQTGITVMYMAEQLDAGDIISSRSTSIDPNETAEELYHRLSVLGAELLGETLPAIESGTAPRTPQDDALATYAPMLSRELSPVDWSRTAGEIHSQVRGLLPWPTATAELGGKKVKIFATEILDRTTEKAPGTLLGGDKKGIQVACGGGTVLRLLELQSPGKRRMSAVDFGRGHGLC